MQTFRKLFVSLLFLCLGAGLLAAEATVQVRPEDTKIEALLVYVSSQTKVKFIRNGSEYDNATAVKFLRGKWDRQRGTVSSAKEFIDKIASRSSTSGKPYRIRLADGQEVDCAVFLSNRLAELESK